MVATTADRVVVVAATLLTAVLGGWRLGTPSFWLDEAWSLAIVDPSAGGGGIGLLTDPDVSGMLYYLVLRGWFGVVGYDEALLRLPSLLFVVATVPLVFLVARQLVAPVTARLATMLFAVNGMALEWAREVRGYALALLLVTAAAAVLLRAVRDADRRWWVAWVALATLAIYAHAFSVLVIGAHVLLLVVVGARGRVRRQGMTAAVALGVALLPLGFFALRAGDGQLWWVPELHPRLFAWVANELVGVRDVRLAVPFVLVGAVGVAVLARRAWTRRRGGDGQSAAFVLTWLVVPLVVNALVSFVRPVFVPRYFVMVLPALAIVLATGVLRFRARPALVAVLVVVLVALPVPTLLERYQPAGREDWRGASDIVEAGWRDGDVIGLWPELNLIPIDYHLRTWDRQDALPVPARSLDPGDFDAGYAGRPDVVEHRVDPSPTDADRVWVVVREPDLDVRTDGDDLVPPGLDGWTLRETWHREMVTVALLEPPPGAD